MNTSKDFDDVLEKSEERVRERELKRLRVLNKHYKQAKQKGELAKARVLRREYLKGMYLEIVLSASYFDLLFPDQKLEAILNKISQELHSSAKPPTSIQNTTQKAATKVRQFEQE